jgi:hypothetical protein
MKLEVLGIDLGKAVFHLVGVAGKNSRAFGRQATPVLLRSKEPTLL